MCATPLAPPPLKTIPTFFRGDVWTKENGNINKISVSAILLIGIMKSHLIVTTQFKVVYFVD